MSAHAGKPSGRLLDIAPVWGRDVYDPHVPSARLEHLNAPDACLVGEAHGFSARYANLLSPYYCETCSTYSWGIWSHSLDPVLLRELAERFAEHFAASHAQVVRPEPACMDMKDAITITVGTGRGRMAA